jgi:hypothetical protein
MRFFVGFAQERLHDFNSQKVTGVVGVDAIGDPEILAGFSFGSQHCIPKVDEEESRLCGDVVFDHLVGFLAAPSFLPTTRAGRHAGESNGHTGLRSANLGHKCFEIRQKLFSGFAAMHIVAADMQNDHSRLIRQNQAVGKVEEVRHLEGINAAVNYCVSWQIVVQSLPPEKLGITSEQDYVPGWRVGFVLSFVETDIVVETVHGRGRAGAGRLDACSSATATASGAAATGWGVVDLSLGRNRDNPGDYRETEPKILLNEFHNGNGASLHLRLNSAIPKAVTVPPAS